MARIVANRNALTRDESNESYDELTFLHFINRKSGIFQGLKVTFDAILQSTASRSTISAILG